MTKPINKYKTITAKQLKEGWIEYVGIKRNLVRREYTVIKDNGDGTYEVYDPRYIVAKKNASYQRSLEDEL